MFDMVGSMNMGLKLSGFSLSPFLYIGITLAIFNLSGKIPVASVLFIILVKGVCMFQIVDFSSFCVMSSIPLQILFFKDLVIFYISVSFVGNINIEFGVFCCLFL